MDTQSMQIRCPKEKARAAFSNFSTLRFQKSVFTGTICMIMSTHTHTICMSYVIFTIVFIITNYLHISTAVRIKLSPVHVHDTTTGMWLRYKSTYTDTTCRSGGTVCTYEKQKIYEWQPYESRAGEVCDLMMSRRRCMRGEGLVQSFATVGARSRQGDKWAYPR